MWARSPGGQTILVSTYGKHGLLTLWGLAAVVAGGVLTSFHQPFLAPDDKIIALAPALMGGQWGAIHVLSGSCACSQRVMRHLLARHRMNGLVEQVVLLDGAEPYLPETASLIARLQQASFPVRHIASHDLPPEYGVHGVPLLLIASPSRQMAYMGGYGAAGDEDVGVVAKLQAGDRPTVLPILGCAVGRQARAQADPFRWKY